jgi:predicted RNA binding protein with dsRBD fold (UPF0201 family)
VDSETKEKVTNKLKNIFNERSWQEHNEKMHKANEKSKKARTKSLQSALNRVYK